jgi:hypothetical protein
VCSLNVAVVHSSLQVNSETKIGQTKTRNLAVAVGLGSLDTPVFGPYTPSLALRLDRFLSLSKRN